MKINPKIREYRVKNRQELKEKIIKEIEKCFIELQEKQDILNIDSYGEYLKKKEKILDIIYDCFSAILALDIKYTKNNYKTFKKDVKILIQNDLFYHEDEKTFEDRLDNIFKDFSSSSFKEQRKYRFLLLLFTESNYITTHTILKKINAEYVEILSGDPDCDICSEYADGELYEIDEIELPPYHPNCQCIEIYYEESDIRGDL